MVSHSRTQLRSFSVVTAARISHLTYLRFVVVIPEGTSRMRISSDCLLRSGARSAYKSLGYEDSEMKLLCSCLIRVDKTSDFRRTHIDNLFYASSIGEYETLLSSKPRLCCQHARHSKISYAFVHKLNRRLLNFVLSVLLICIRTEMEKSIWF